MSDVPVESSKRVGRSPDGYLGPWGHLDKEKREQHERIEARVKEKVRLGLL